MDLPDSFLCYNRQTFKKQDASQGKPDHIHRQAGEIALMSPFAIAQGDKIQRNLRYTE
jgi:hypothetical protein